MHQAGAFQDYFTIRQLVFVNSAAYAYTEIRVDQHTALFGRNNLGKTSMLNALKLFLLPEENFRRCEKKFGFKGANGNEYNGQESYGYYFPEDHSFIILEAENVHGTFCLVLHRANREFSYGRMAVSCKYDMIRSLFWDFNSNENEGLGGPHESLSLKSLLSELKRLGGEQFSDIKTIKERLFSEKPLDPLLGRYCLLPLKQGGTAREIEAWRQLIHLAFDISARDDQTLPNAVATIIEGEKQREAEQVSIDFDQILGAYRSLKEEGDRLQKLQNHQPTWEALDSNYKKYEHDSKRAAQLYVNVEANLNRSLGRLTQAVNDGKEKYQEVHRKFEGNRKLFRQKEGELKDISGQKKPINRQVKSTQNSLKRIAEIVRAYPESFSNDQILDALVGYRQELKQDIESLQSAEARQRRMESLIRESRRLKSEEERLGPLLEGVIPTLLERVSSDSAAVLYSINQKFSQIKVQPSDEKLEIIQQFSSLFEEDGGNLSFLNEAFLDLPFVPFDAQKSRMELKARLDDIRKQQQQADRELTGLNALGKQSSGELEHHLREKRKEVERVKEDVELVKAYTTLKSQAADSQNELQSLEQQSTALGQELDKLKGKHDVLSRELTAKEDAFKADEEKKVEVDSLLSQLVTIKDAHARIIDAWKGTLEPENMEVENGTVDALREQARSLQQLGEEVVDSASKLLQANLLEEGVSEGYRQLSFKDVKHYRNRFSREFDTLDGRWLNYRDRVASHNKETSIKMDELKGAAKQIQTFSHEINKQFKDYQVSNLAEVQVCLTLHPRFEQLLKELETINFYTEELHDARLYSRLNDFCEEFFKKLAKGVPTLSMDQIIQKVYYRYRLEGLETYDDKEQSNGTTSMVNSLLLSVLIKRLLRSDAQICIPLIMDEMGSLDRENLKTATRIAEEHGFVLFGASPDISSEIVQAVKNYVNLGSFRATTASYNGRRRVVYHSYCERLFKEPNQPVPEVVS
ncbi:MAG: hypothetical protein ACPGMR_00160 [Pontibacterium sp.]